MKDATIFLAGHYDRQQVPFYRGLCMGRFTVAADGGYSFFAMILGQPDLLIGDLDSIEEDTRRLPDGLTIIQHPEDKGCTDGELALAYCLDNGARSIDIVDPSCGQVDHFLGNLMLLERASGEADRTRVRIVNHLHEIRLLSDTSWTISGCAGDVVSVIPLSSRIRLSCTGTEYPANRVLIRRGQTAGLRNSLVNRRARLSVEGKAFVVHAYGPSE